MVASNNTEPGAWPQTRCANCQTIFEVPSELLDSNDTRVRCGECLSIFDALEGVRQQKVIDHEESKQESDTASRVSLDNTPDSEPQPDVNQFSNLDSTYSDFDLFSDDAGLPELRYFEQERDKAEFNFDSVEIVHDQTFSETLFVNDVTIDADLPFVVAGVTKQASNNNAGAQDSTDKDTTTDDEAAEDTSSTASGSIENGLQNQANVEFHTPKTSKSSEPLIFQYHDPDDTDDVTSMTQDMIDQSTDLVSPFAKSHAAPSGKRRFAWLPAIAAILVLSLLFGSLYLYRQRGELYNDPRVRPVYAAFCSLAGCTVPLPFDPEQMGLLRRSIYPHPKVEGALVINVVLKNKADFAQRYPVLVIRLEENSGAAMATRDFSPKDYLQSRLWHENALIEAGAAVSITLEIKDPGENAGSFTLNFR